LAASIPSQVEAILIKILSLEMPFSSYNLITLLALYTVASVSKLNLASTSVLTTPGTNFNISHPKFTANLSIISPVNSFYYSELNSPKLFSTDFLPYSIAESKIALYSSILAAYNIKEGLVVASSGEYYLI